MAVLHKFAVNSIRGTLICGGIAFMGLAAVSVLWLWGYVFLEAGRDILIVGYEPEIYTGIGSMYIPFFYSLGPLIIAYTGYCLFAVAVGDTFLENIT